MKRENLWFDTKRAVLVMVGLVTCLVFLIRILDSSLQITDRSDQFTSVSHHASLASDDHSGRVPLLPVPDPFEPPTPDEAESKDECDDEITKLFAHLSPNLSERLHGKKQLFLNSKISIENRSSVSLFVLYHCWKSFPC